MAVTAVRGKDCTLKIGSNIYTGWVQGLDTSGERASEMVPTWGEDVAYTGARTNTGELTFLFDPTTSALGPALEGAFEDATKVTLEVAMGTATRTYTGWSVTAYSDSLPADGLATCKASLIGPDWATTYHA